MNIHKNARLTPQGRALLVDLVLVDGLSFRAAASQIGVDPKTVSRWVHRFQSEGHSGLFDRSSAPHTCPTRIADPVSEKIVELRRMRWTMERIADNLGVSRSTVWRCLTRAGLNRLRSLDPTEPPQRYQHDHPGDLLHLDIKKLGRFQHPGHRRTNVRQKQSRGIGWEFVHVAIDDRSRVATATMHPSERVEDAIRALDSALGYYQALGVTIQRLLTDNGSCYRSKAFARAVEDRGLTHTFTKPYRPQTNGKAERFIQTALREWAYAHTYDHSEERKNALPTWIHDYNWHRRHGSLEGKTPISVLDFSADNLLRLHN